MPLKMAPLGEEVEIRRLAADETVSYTHLTLPTKVLV